MRGLVLAVLPHGHEIVVRYDAFLDKPAGIATFRVDPASFGALRAGATIDATADEDTAPWSLSAVHAIGSESLTGSGGVQLPTPSPLVNDVHHVAVGEIAPNATFLDQTGRTVTLSSLHGRMVVIAFFYSRCKDLRECPFVSSRFHTMQQKFAGLPVHLIEVTLDPAYDRPGVLANYARQFGADPARWTLATGDPNDVMQFARAFDVTAFPDEKIGLIHPERLAIIDQYGSIRELVDEGSWSPNEVVAAVRNDANLASNPFERFNLYLSSAAVSICGNSVAGFSGFSDLVAVILIVSIFGFLFYKIGRGIARGAA